MRGVEVGSIGRAISVAPAVGRGASFGPSLGRIGGIPTPRMEGFSMSRITNPFLGIPKASTYIENRGPSLLEPNIGVIRRGLIAQRNPEAKTPSQTISVGAGDLPSGTEAVKIAEKWLGISNQPQRHPEFISGSHEIPKQVEQTLRERNDGFKITPMDFAWTRPAVLPFSYVGEPKIQPKSGQIEFSKSYPHSAVLTEVNKKSVQENAVGQNFEEEILIKEKVDEKPEISEREEVEEWEIKDLLDEETAETRVYEISEAIDLAETEAKKEGVEEIDGPRILKFLRLHIGLISRIARKIRKDGSLDETLEELVARKFSSQSQAKAQTKELVFEKEPVRRGKEGKAVKEGALERVFKYYFVKRSPGKEVVKRVVKKLIQTGHQTGPVQVQSVDTGVREPRIEDNADLAEVFLRKAA